MTSMTRKIADGFESPAFLPDLIRVHDRECDPKQPFRLCEIADEVKLGMRRVYNQVHPLNYPQALRQARDFWSRYELVNRVLCENDPVYSNVRAGAALSTTADHIFFKAAAAGQGRILEVIIGGEATSSAVNRVEVAQMNATLAGNSNVTPEKFNSRSPAAAGTYGNGNTSALIAGAMLVFAFNAFGGFIDWKAAPGEEMYYVNAEVIGLRSLSGTSTCSSTGVFEEL